MLRARDGGRSAALLPSLRCGAGRRAARAADVVAAGTPLEFVANPFSPASHRAISRPARVNLGNFSARFRINGTGVAPAAIPLKEVGRAVADGTMPMGAAHEDSSDAGLPLASSAPTEEVGGGMTEDGLLALGEFVERKAARTSDDDAQRAEEPEPEPEREPEYNGPPGGDPYLLERMDRLRVEFQEDQLRKDFAAADTDGSGAIDREEFTRLMWKLQGSMTEAEIQQQLDIVDSDGDGEISFDEFRVWWTSPPMEKLRKQHRARLGIAEEWDPGDVERRMAVKRGVCVCLSLSVALCRALSHSVALCLSVSVFLTQHSRAGGGPACAHVQER